MKKKKSPYDITYKEFQTFATMLISIKADHWESDDFSGTIRCPFCQDTLGYAFLNGGYNFKRVQCNNKACRANAIWKQIEHHEKEKKRNV